MQPIVLKIANKDDFADYADGLEPDSIIEESFRTLGTLGSRDEPLLAEAIRYLTGGTAKSATTVPSISRDLLIQDPLLYKMQGMFVDKNRFQNQGKR